MKKINYNLIGIIAIAVAVFLISQNNRPEFFDIFGLAVFSFLTIVGYLIFVKKKKMPEEVEFAIFIIGLLGLIVDGFIVFKTFLIN